MGLLEALRSRRLPGDAGLVLEPEERVVAWARAEDGSIVAATSLGLHAGDRLVRWEAVNKATWDAGTMTVVPAEILEESEVAVVADGPPLRLRLVEPRNLPAEVRARVTRCIRHSTRHAITGGAVRVIGRQVPGRDGLVWSVRFDPGTPADAEAAAALVDAARSATGPAADL
jgi:hypothetical protein